MDADGQVCVEPIKVLQTRSRSLRSRKIIEVLVQWTGYSSKDAMWESLYTLASSFLPSPCGQGVSIGGGGNVRHLSCIYVIGYKCVCVPE